MTDAEMLEKLCFALMQRENGDVEIIDVRVRRPGVVLLRAPEVPMLINALQRLYRPSIPREIVDLDLPG